MNAKTILITGSTDGIGLETAKNLTAKGHKVILHGRKEKRLNEAKSYIYKNTKLDVIDTVQADFAKIDEVKQMASYMNNTYSSLDLLINNAGVFRKFIEYTDDGLEKTFGINHIAHFLLTQELLPLLIQSEQGRIVVVSSMIHANDIDFSNLQGEKFYDGNEAYSRSKLANLLFCKALSRRLEETKVTVNALHPGVINTKLLKASFGPFGNALSEGAENLIFAALDPSLSGVSGKYLKDSRITEPAKIATDQDIQEKLWDISEKILEKHSK
ncbi:MAG: SDR family NAD(P)-dependent oxidoreductase [Bacteroidales bacterium]|nr:SDR family NAD(P)-dependent oxidoreductase [Bacteroidales bacterium]MCF8328693.1 SDR family NAD(P)-dependent oxidoreductase [Bacteroidales bacterium]